MLELSTEEAALALELSTAQVRRLVRSGVLRDVSLTRRVRVDPDGVRREVARRVDDGRLSPLAEVVVEALVAGERAVCLAARRRPRPRAVELVVGAACIARPTGRGASEQRA
jgi:hypothetical protein